MSHYKHWIVEKDAEGIIFLGFNREKSTVNTINGAVLDELNSLLQDIAKDFSAKGLILYSAKEKGFIAGADVHEFSQFNTEDEIVDFLRKGQAVFARLENLSIPTVAMIHGFCMGGGLELSLACNYRIISDDEETRIGLPEILLGFHPGWGGTVRLPRLIGGFSALTQVILTGQSLTASRAKKLGIADEVVPYRQLKRAAQYYIQNKPPKHKPTRLQELTNHVWMRKLIAILLRRQVGKRINQAHYPAPFAVIDFWEREGCEGDRPYFKEIDSVEHLVAHSDTAKNLIRIFGLRERMKAFAKGHDFKAILTAIDFSARRNDIERAELTGLSMSTRDELQQRRKLKCEEYTWVHVIGAGVMGGDIAAWCALKGLKVTLQDQSFDKIAPAIGRAHALFKKKLKHTRPIQAALDRLSPDPKGYGIAQADVIIEAVFENLAVKQAIMKSIEKKAKKDAIIASNTSSIPLDEINHSMHNPNRLVGIHFFNPVAKMELIEVVTGKKTDTEVAAKACAFVAQIGRLPLPVKSMPGFLINRVLMPYLLESMQLIEEGYSERSIDEAACAFGMLMGPVELADTVGLDVCLAVAENLTATLGGSVPQRLYDLVKAGKLGRKTGQGFYQYKNGKAVKPKVLSEKPMTDVANRLILRMVNEAYACLRDQVVVDSDLLDAGMIFGTGFAPFLGGPMHYAQQLGKAQQKELFARLASQYGERFKMESSMSSN